MNVTVRIKPPLLMRVGKAGPPRPDERAYGLLATRRLHVRLVVGIEMPRYWIRSKHADNRI